MLRKLIVVLLAVQIGMIATSKAQEKTKVGVAVNWKGEVWINNRQLGEEIAAGEKRFLVKRIQEKVEMISESCNEKTDEISIVLKEIQRLNSSGQTPDVILAPPSMLKSFVHFCH